MPFIYFYLFRTLSCRISIYSPSTRCFCQGTQTHAWTLFASFWSSAGNQFLWLLPSHWLGQWTKSFSPAFKEFIAKEPSEMVGRKLDKGCCCCCWQHGSILWLHFAGLRQFQAFRSIYIIEMNSTSSKTSASNRMYIPLPARREPSVRSRYGISSSFHMRKCELPA